jgi:UDP-glucose:(heptosyl)LPS alpha-1,3-glucosyltransferase
MQRLQDGARATAQGYGWDQVGLQYIELLRQIDAAKRQTHRPAVPLSAEA